MAPMCPHSLWHLSLVRAACTLSRQCALLERAPCVSWRVSQALGADYWARLSSGGTPSVPSKSSRTADECSCSGSSMGACQCSQSGMTSAPSTASPGADASTSSAVDSPAKTSAALASGQAWTELTQACGSRCSESLAKFGLRMSLPKIHQTCALEAWVQSSVGLPRWGMMQRGVCWALGKSVHRIQENACGSRPTWPTPKACMGAKGWTLRLAWDPRRTSLQVHNTIASERAQFGNYPRSTLIEWLMGWPVGWTALEPLATDRFRSWLRLHGRS